MHVKTSCILVHYMRILLKISLKVQNISYDSRLEGIILILGKKSTYRGRKYWYICLVLLVKINEIYKKIVADVINVKSFLR